MIENSELDQVESSEDEKIYFTNEELLYLELNLEKTKVCDEQNKGLMSIDRIRQLEVDNLKLQGDILALKAQARSKTDPKVTAGMEYVKNNKEKLLEEKNKFLEAMNQKYNLGTTTFGFNPETGEIVVDAQEEGQRRRFSTYALSALEVSFPYSYNRGKTQWLK